MAPTEANAPTETVRQFQAAMASGDVSRAKSLVTADLHFRGPIDEFHTADEYLAALGRLAKIVKGMENMQVFAEGDRVAVFYDLVTNTPAGTSPTAELYTVRRGKITAIQAIFDARPFAAMFAKK